VRQVMVRVPGVQLQVTVERHLRLELGMDE
jgi:hypothetical protein